MTHTQPRRASRCISGRACSSLRPITHAPPWTCSEDGHLRRLVWRPRRCRLAMAVRPVANGTFLTTSTSRGRNGSPVSRWRRTNPGPPARVGPPGVDLADGQPDEDEGGQGATATPIRLRECRTAQASGRRRARRARPGPAATTRRTAATAGRPRWPAAGAGGARARRAARPAARRPSTSRKSSASTLTLPIG